MQCANFKFEYSVIDDCLESIVEWNSGMEHWNALSYNVGTSQPKFSGGKGNGLRKRCLCLFVVVVVCVCAQLLPTCLVNLCIRETVVMVDVGQGWPRRGGGGYKIGTCFIVYLQY